MQGSDRAAGRHRDSGLSQRAWVAMLGGGLIVVVAATALVANAATSPAPTAALQPAPPWTPPGPAPQSSQARPVTAEPVESVPPPTSAATTVATTVASGPTATTATPGPTILTVTAATVPDVVDLSGQGALDWVHWGLQTGSSTTRKSGQASLIQDLGGPGDRGRYDNNPQVFSWSDGSPTGSVTRTPTGVYACGQGSGFALRVPAGPATRTLRLYAGVWKAAGRLDLSLAGKRATASLENPGRISTAQFVIRFRAPAGGTLSITWTATAVFDAVCGNVDMQAAALS